MEIYVCVSIDGGSIDGGEFSPKAFQSELDPNLLGTTKFRKRLRNGVVEQFGLARIDSKPVSSKLEGKDAG